MEALHFRERRSAESEQEGAGAVGGEEGPPGVFCQLVVFPAPWAEGCSGAQLPHAHGDWQADLPGLQRDLREVAPTGPGLGLDKSVMLGYLWIQYPMCLDIIPPNLFKTKLDRGRSENHTLDQSQSQGSLIAAVWKPVSEQQGQAERWERVSVFQPLEKRPEDFTFPSTLCSLQVTAKAE